MGNFDMERCLETYMRARRDEMGKRFDTGWMLPGWDFLG